jgi:hypothetical protein
MWRGKGWLPRHAARRGQRGHRVQIMFVRGYFKKIIKNRLKLKKYPKISESGSVSAI